MEQFIQSLNQQQKGLLCHAKIVYGCRQTLQDFIRVVQTWSPNAVDRVTDVTMYWLNVNRTKSSIYPFAEST
ncbi:hypothetical protein GCM10027565_27290 [Bordetella tumulicola]